MENFGEEFEKYLEESLNLKTYSRGERVKGKIVKFDKDIAYIDIGTKTEVVIPSEEVNDLNEGDEIEAIFTRRKRDGYWVITRKPILFQLRKEKLKNALKDKSLLKAKLIEPKEKGYIVEVEGLKAYLPKSESGLKSKEEELPLEFNVIVIKVEDNSRGFRVVVSRKQAIEKEQEKIKEQLIEKMKREKRIKGEVLKLTPKGAVISIENIIYGFLPNSLYSWDKDKTTDELKIGEEIELAVMEIDEKNNKFILSKKALEPNPWDIFDKKVGDVVEGTVKNINDYGLVVKVNGIEGFIYKMETEHLYPERYKSKFKIGDKIKGKIIELDKKKKRLKISIKALEPHPVDKFLTENPEGSSIKGRIKEIKNKVAVIDLGNDLEGILNLKDATWNPKIKNISQILKGKTEEEFMVLGREGNRIKLGLKQFKPDPWKTFKERYKVGDIVKVKVKKLIDRGAFVDILEDVEGFIPLKEISKEPIEIPSDKLKLGEEVGAKIKQIKGFDITLSIKAIELDKEKKELEEIVSKFKPKDSSKDSGLATLGELLKKKLQEKRG